MAIRKPSRSSDTRVLERDADATPARPRRVVSRRRFLQAGAAGAASLAGLAPVGTARGAEPQSAGSNGGAGAAPYVPRPNPTQIALRVQTTALNPDGKQDVGGVTANGAFPGPEIRLRRGDLFRARVENALAKEGTSIHWHGLLVPAGMDGVPNVSNAPVGAAREQIYEFPIVQTGTYWYHSHFGLQEQIGLFGPLIIEEPDAPAERDAVVLLSDWLHRSPYAVLAELRRGAAAARPGKAMAGAPASGKAKMPMAAAPAAMPGGPAKPDLSDVKYDAFLLNGRSAAAPWTFAAEPGERVRLRIVNAGASTYFRVRLDGTPLLVTHADGIALEPIEVDHLLMGMGESYDALVALREAGSYTLHAVAQDGSGQAIGVLHTAGTAPVVNPEIPRFDGRALEDALLRAAAPTALPDGPTRAFDLALQGDMARYVWTIDGQAYPKADPLLIRRGDRVQLTLRNDTMMWHPMHLHGHFFRLLKGGGDHCPLKHTVNVPPRETRVIEFFADNPGAWIFHCHNLYHLEAGMARVFEYEA